ncbi:MAG: MMPL family transporter [Magnetococcales bacterium]|nr:MMPL family transporter [Magnetococcales bacterium]
MNLSQPFIHRPVATSLLTFAILLAGWMAFLLLPVAPLPQVDFPIISVQASLPGASPETMAAIVATPLERFLGRIAGVNEITSASSLGNTRITLQFDLERNIDGAARDVQAAIAAARTLLPSGMPANPTFRKMNPADMPVLVLSLTSDLLSQGKLYDLASTVMAQRLSQLEGVGQVSVGGSSMPAVRVELNLEALQHYGISLEEVRSAITSTHANRPKGVVEEGDRQWVIDANDQASKAADYLPLILTYRQGAAVRLADVAQVEDSVQDVRHFGSADGKTSVLLILSRMPGANIIETIDRVRQALPMLQANLPASVKLTVLMDRTPTIRASLREAEQSLLISVGMVVLVVFLFLPNLRATLIPSVAVPVSLVGTFGVIYLMGYSLNTMSLMALTIATGFVVDDAIVVVENVSRYREAGYSPLQAALLGTKEVGFTVLSMSLSLVAVFIPLLAMGGIVGRLFREFSVTLVMAVLVSLLVSLTTTPAMCAALLKKGDNSHGGWFARHFDRWTAWYDRSLAWALQYKLLTLLVLFATIGLNFYLYTIIPKGFFPSQDTGRLMGSIQGDQGISFQAMEKKMNEYIRLVMEDEEVEHVAAFTGGDQRNSGRIFLSLRPLGERTLSAEEVMARLRKRTSQVTGASLIMQSVQDLRVGGRHGNAMYQYTVQSSELEELRQWEPRLRQALRQLPQLVDVSGDQQDKGLATLVQLDRDAASRLGITPRILDSTLNNAFGQRQVATIYAPLNQYRVVMEADPRFWQDESVLEDIQLTSPTGKQVPLAAVTTVTAGNAPLVINHQGLFAASTITFNLAPGVSLSQATQAIDASFNQMGVPSSIQGGFQGTAKIFQQSMANMPWMILAALVTVYIVLGILYESTVHPITILSTLPSAGVGALLALLMTHGEFNIIALIGVILLIGIVKKNAILMIDFALILQRRDHLPALQAIQQASVLRFRPILMTTLAAMFGALPLAFGSGEGAGLRQPLGISIVGGLLVSQILTLYTTPVVFLYLDRLRQVWKKGDVTP